MVRSSHDASDPDGRAVSARAKRSAGIVAATVGALLATLYPHFPGSYDVLAVPISGIVRFLAWPSLLLVPAGALWLATKRRGARIAALAVLSIILLVAAFLALMTSAILAVLVLALGVLSHVRLHRSEATSITPAIYMVVVPPLVLALQWVLVPRAVEYSRDRAIRNSAAIIADIEGHRARNGEYPTSILSLWRDYSPDVIGIDRYRYERRGAAYNLVFENPALAFGTNEIVVYNPRDEQVFTSHALDLLQNSPEQLALEWTRGHYAVRQASQPHWKYFWFD